MAPLSNDLLLAAALTSAVPAALAQPTAAPGRPQSGVVTAVKAGAVRGTSSTLYIDSAAGQRLTTDANTTLHVLFSDQSAVTVAPNSELVIAKYQFDPKVKEGQILLEMTKGLLRVVGGLISKKTETVVRTSTATIGIRGGISTLDVSSNQTSSTFLFGQQMRATDSNGNTQTVTRPGFGINTGSNQPPSTPQRVPSNELSAQLQRLESNTTPQQQNTQPGGAPPGQLLSTGNIPGGSGNPVSNLSSDRVTSNSSTRIDNTLRNILATGIVQNQS